MRWLLSILFVISCSVAFAAEDTTPTTVGTVSLENTEAAATAEQASPTMSATTASETLPPAKDTRTESEIPLNLDGPKKAAGDGGGIFRILFTIAVMGIVGIGAFIFIRKYKVPQASKHQTQIKVLQQHFLGPKKSLAIIRVAGESILIGITDQNISMIKNLSLLDDEVPEEAPKNFGNVLGGFNIQEDEQTAPASNKRSTASRELDSDEEFAISGIKDIVSKRLKGMRSL